MKSLKCLFTAAACLLTLNACASKPANSNVQPQTNENMKAVIVYFTHSGNTELAAKDLA